MCQHATSYLRSRLRFFAVLALLLVGVLTEGVGQDKKRTYANFQGTYEAGVNLLGLLTGTVSNAGHAVDGNVTTHSTLSVPVGVLGLLSATQYLEFTTDGNHRNVRTIPAGTPVTVKSSFPAEILGLLSSVEIGYFSDLEPVGFTLSNRAGYNTGNRTVEYAGAALLNLLNGTGQFEITFAPDDDYQGVFVKLSGNGLSVLLSNQLFHAYIYEDYSYTSCAEKHQPLDVLHGTRSESIGALTSLGGVTNPYNILNSDHTDYATMNVGVGALNTIYLNTVFPTPSDPRQAVRVVLEDPESLLDLSVLSSFSFQPYNRDVAVGSPITANGSLISARLLPGTKKYELAFKIDDPFDRVELRFDNTVTVLTSLRIYEVSRLPRVMVIEDPTVLTSMLTGCGSVSLQAAITNYQPDYYDYHYYTTASGGTALPSSMVDASGTYYIEAVDKETGCVSPRAQVDATVYQLPSVTISSTPTACEGDAIANLVLINPVANPTGYSIEWVNAPEDFENVDWGESELTFVSPIAISIPATTVMGDYDGILKVRNDNCESEEIPFTLKVLPLPGKPHLTITDAYN